MTSSWTWQLHGRLCQSSKAERKWRWLTRELRRAARIAVQATRNQALQHMEGGLRRAFFLRLGQHQGWNGRPLGLAHVLQEPGDKCADLLRFCLALWHAKVLVCLVCLAMRKRTRGAASTRSLRMLSTCFGMSHVRFRSKFFLAVSIMTRRTSLTSTKRIVLAKLSPPENIGFPQIQHGTDDATAEGSAGPIRLRGECKDIC
mmetsp:Transcript_64319/g.140001  ORF Transcript_64319/g.140001 Transcript_64319/m.140001 type:complete len:202 (-) Transcript_64319:10-615(-)